MRWRLNAFWDWFWYFRSGKVRYRVWDYGDSYNAMASNGQMTVYNCYGSTPEQAKEMAKFRLKEALNREEKELELVHKGNGFALYKDKNDM